MADPGGDVPGPAVRQGWQEDRERQDCEIDAQRPAHPRECGAVDADWEQLHETGNGDRAAHAPGRSRARGVSEREGAGGDGEVASSHKNVDSANRITPIISRNV